MQFAIRRGESPYYLEIGHAPGVKALGWTLDLDKRETWESESDVADAIDALPHPMRLDAVVVWVQS